MQAKVSEKRMVWSWSHLHALPVDAGRRRPSGDHHLDDPLRMVQRGLQGVGQAPLDPLLDDQAVHDDVDVVLLVLVEDDLFGQIILLAVDDHPGEAVLAELVQLLAVLPLAPPDHGGEQRDAAFPPAGP